VEKTICHTEKIILEDVPKYPIKEYEKNYRYRSFIWTKLKGGCCSKAIQFILLTIWGYLWMYRKLLELEALGI